MMKRIKSYIKEITQRIVSTERKYFLQKSFIGFFQSIVISELILFMFASSETLMHFTLQTREILFFVWLIFTVLLFALLVFTPLLKAHFIFNKSRTILFADKIGAKFPQIKDELKNSLQLLENENSQTPKFFIEEAFKQVYKKCEGLNFLDTVSLKRIEQKVIGFLLLSTILLVLIGWIKPFSEGFYRVYNYKKNFESITKLKFTVKPGNISLIKGDSLAIEVKPYNKKLKEVTLKIKQSEEVSFSTKKNLPDSLGNFVYKIFQVDKAFKYYVEAEKVKSEIYDVKVISFPLVSKMEVKINSPSYAKLPTEIQKDNGHITALKGSRINIFLEATKSLSKARISFVKRGLQDMKVSKNKVDAKFNIIEDDEYFITLVDTLNNQNKNPIKYKIKILKDEFPSIEILYPNKNINLDITGKTPIALAISDDYGFSKLLLKYRISESNYKEISQEFSELVIPFNKSVKENNIYYTWELASFLLTAGDVVSYYFEIFDNDNISGPKSTSTKTFTLHVPSLDELFTEAESIQNKAEEKMLSTLKEAKELQTEFERTSNKLKQKEKNISWEEKENLNKLKEKFEELQKKAMEAKKALSQAEDKFRKDDLLSKETMQKYKELQKLFDDMNKDGSLNSLKQLQKAFSNMQRNQVQNSFEDLKKDEDTFMKSIERTIALLKKVKIEQKTDEIKKRIENILEQQNSANKELEKNISDRQTEQKLEQQQKEISEKIKKLEEEMQNLEKQMSELKDMPIQKIKDINKAMKRDANNKLSEEAISKMKKGESKAYRKPMEQISSNMEKMKSEIEKMQSSMSREKAMENFSEMFSVTNKLLELSKEEEKLRDEFLEFSSDKKKKNDFPERQNNIRKNLENVIEGMSGLSKKTFAITPEMGRALGKSNKAMQDVIDNMQDGFGSSVKQKNDMTTAMSGLNEAIEMLKNSMNAMMNSSGSGEGREPSFMEQLQNFSNQQMNVNALTKALKEGGKLTPKQQAELERITGQQELIRKSLEQLDEESKAEGKSKSVATNLQKVLEDMEEVIKNMQSRNLSDDLVQRQERILSKLLDAQRSINERDFEKDRKSITGKNFNRKSPPEIIFSTEEGKNKLRDELIKAFKEGYNKDYEELIKRYFNSLEKNKKEIPISN